MKRLYTLIPLLLLFISAITYGQKIRFTDTVNSWKIQGSAGWPDKVTYGYYSIQFDSLVTKNGITYTSIAQYGLCREDTIQNKVYVLHANDTVEKVLYDYNLQVGDTFAYQFWGLGNKDAKGIVVYIDSVLITGNYHKIWRFHNFIPNLYPGSIIEGVGIMAWGTPEVGSNVVCFNRNGVMVTINNYIDALSCALDVNNINTNNKTISIFPNPANQYSKITFPYNIQSGTLTITDVLGKTINTQVISNRSEIVIGEMPASSFYFYQLTDLIQNQSYTGKFIYE